jgi:hypothetical protein
MKFKTLDELRRMTGMELRAYRTQLWVTIHSDMAEAERSAWRPILRAVERSQESKAALMVKHGGLTVGIVTVEFFAGDTFDDALVRLSVDRRGGRATEEYMPQPEELMAYLRRLGIDPYDSALRWEPV